MIKTAFGVVVGAFALLVHGSENDLQPIVRRFEEPEESFADEQTAVIPWEDRTSGQCQPKNYEFWKLAVGPAVKIAIVTAAIPFFGAASVGEIVGISLIESVFAAGLVGFSSYSI